jgi:hypothetical protein
MVNTDWTLSIWWFAFIELDNIELALHVFPGLGKRRRSKPITHFSQSTSIFTEQVKIVVCENSAGRIDLREPHSDSPYKIWIKSRQDGTVLPCL